MQKKTKEDDTWYRTEVAKMLEKIKDVRFLRRIYIIISDYVKNETD